MTTNYDIVVIFHVDPDGLNTQLTTLNSLIQDVVDSLNNIATTLSGLQLGWSGQTAEEAKDFGDQWSAMMAELMGTKQNPDAGVLNAIYNGIDTTRGNFALAEQSLVDFFTKFSNGLTGGGSATTPTSPPPSITDITQTAITETW